MKKTKAAPPPEHYPVVIISDTHLGIDSGANDLLCEFLRNTKCDKLILNGDIIDGVRLNARAPAEFPEGHKRIMDAINRKIAEGTEVIYMPGNHDAELRRKGLFGKTVMGLKFERSLDFTDPKGKHFFIAHGDSFDRGQTNPRKIPAVAHKIFDHGYIAITRISAAIDRVSQKLLKKRFAVASRSRRTIENVIGATRHHEESATGYAKEHGFDGVICGHFHVEAKKTKDGVLYLNSGDWVESFTALTLDKNGDWNVVKWPDKRKGLDLKREFRPAANDNPDKAFRPVTEKFLAEIKKIWPGRKPKNAPKP